MMKNKITIKTITKQLTRAKNSVNLTPSLQKDNGLCNSYDIGVSAPFGIALFLCQKSTFMVGVSRESSDCRFLCHGLQTRFTSTAQSFATLVDGLSNLTKGKDYAPHIQHSSSHRSATSQNQNPFNPSSLYAHQGRLPFAFCASTIQGGVA